MSILMACLGYDTGLYCKMCHSKQMLTIYANILKALTAERGDEAAAGILLASCRRKIKMCLF